MIDNLLDEKIRFLEEKAHAIRRSIVESLVEAGSGHTAGSLGMTDVFTLLFFHILRHNPSDPFWDRRDRFVLSNGHICPGLYATMAHAGYFSIEELKTLRKFGSRLQGHPHREYLPGIENSSGPLGSGISQAIGMALADRIELGKSSDKYFYCMTGDGELNCGQIWEAVLLAGKERLHNLIVIVDRNNIQIDGFTENVMPLESLRDKFQAFNWHVQEANGHSFESLNDAFGQARAVFSQPSVIIANNIPGKGVHFAERRFEWHGAPPGHGPENVVPKKDQGQQALNDLRSLHGRIYGEHE